jgi:hypothetical protein
MPDCYMDVDTAVVVPMNIFPITDDTDFKSIETALVYNSGGIVVYWHFITTAGVMTTTIIHPTTAGVHDIAEPLADVGMYTIEIPASGGDHANNDAEGGLDNGIRHGDASLARSYHRFPGGWNQQRPDRLGLLCHSWIRRHGPTGCCR